MPPAKRKFKMAGGRKCGAKRRGSDGRCNLAAGWGTNHPGTGRCKMHGGSMPNHVKNAAKQELSILMGRPIEMNPLDALLWCIKLTAGEVQWLGEKIATLDKTEWVEMNDFGQRSISHWAKERQAAVDRLAKYSNMAISLGLAERAVRLAEQYGEMIARLIRGILEDLSLTEEQQKIAPAIVRRHLVLVDSGQPIGPEDRKELVAGG